MPTPTTSTKRRRPGRKADDFRLVWKKQAADAVFAGKALADLEAAMAALQKSSEELSDLVLSRSAAQRVRDDDEAALNALLVLVTLGVRSHPEHGENSPLYRSMGFVPKIERRSGLVRRPNEDGGDPAAANEEAAV